MWEELLSKVISLRLNDGAFIGGKGCISEKTQSVQDFTVSREKTVHTCHTTPKEFKQRDVIPTVTQDNKCCVFWTKKHSSRQRIQNSTQNA